MFSNFSRVIKSGDVRVAGEETMRHAAAIVASCLVTASGAWLVGAHGRALARVSTPWTASQRSAAARVAPPSACKEEDAPFSAEIQTLVSRDSTAAIDGADLHHVLLIYTGGTLGMTKQNGTLAPKKGALVQTIRQMPEVHDPSMPALDILEYEPLIDSSNVSPDDWARLARQIRDSYYDYDGFVIVHGTDTMAYTASALSFMLEGLGKAVVLTGSMIPLAEVYNDARRNLIISITFAAQLELCEVAIFFNDRLLRGNRAVKVDSNGLAAFESPNFAPLATVGASIFADRSRWRAPPQSRMRVHTNLDASVICIRLAPGFDDSAILAMLRHATSLKGLVLSLCACACSALARRACTVCAPSSPAHCVACAPSPPAHRQRRRANAMRAARARASQNSRSMESVPGRSGGLPAARCLCSLRGPRSRRDGQWAVAQVRIPFGHLRGCLARSPCRGHLTMHPRLRLVGHV